jgi:hypothetical protein
LWSKDHCETVSFKKYGLTFPQANTCIFSFVARIKIHSLGLYNRCVHHSQWNNTKNINLEFIPHQATGFDSLIPSLLYLFPW